MWMWHLRTWFSRRGGVGVTVGVGDLRGLSNLNDSVILFCDSTNLTIKCLPLFYSSMMLARA